MYRTHTCGELRLLNAGEQVTLAGWVQRIRNFGSMLFIDLRDRYGITQLVFPEGNQGSDNEISRVAAEQAKQLGREYVIAVTGKVTERSNKNLQLSTGEIEIFVEQLNVLNASKTPPFTIEDDTDGGDELRMKYRFLDLRRNVNKDHLLQRHQVARAVREYLDEQGFVDIETPHLIKSTPEGARDFVVPSRMNQGQFYALPQSPQTFKQLLMVAGYDRYYQIVRCFRDEDLRQDRQPEFTQIDCEMAFVRREDVIDMFERMVKFIFEKVRNIQLPTFPRMSYDDAMRWYGNDKPDIRFEMKFIYLKESGMRSAKEGRHSGDLPISPAPDFKEKDLVNAASMNSSEAEGYKEVIGGENFPLFQQAEAVIGICARGCAHYSRKQLDELNDLVKRPQLGASGLVYIRWNDDDSFKSSIDKFYSSGELKNIAKQFKAQPGDLILILAGALPKTRKALSELRLEMGNRLGLRKKDDFKPLWVLDFPLLEWDEDESRWNAMHHPFTSWRMEDNEIFNKDPGSVKANAYDVVLNGVEIGGGSIRIHNRDDQMKMFHMLGLSKEKAEQQFGFILNAFEFGAPPHGGIAFGFDRFCSMVIANQEGIRDFIAFPKNNMGRDMMLDAPSEIDERQKKELGL